jgi:hypothetical protein
MPKMSFNKPGYGFISKGEIMAACSQWSRAAIALVYITLILTAASFAKTYYVSADKGDNSFDGSESKPFKTIQKGADVAQAGDIVLVLPGIYRERVAPPRGGSSGNPITFKSSEKQKAIIRGSTVWTPDWKKVDGHESLYYGIPDAGLFPDNSHIDGANPFEISLNSAPKGHTLGQVFIDSEMMTEVAVFDSLPSQSGAWHYKPDEKAIYINFPSGKAPGSCMVEIANQRRVFAPHKRSLGYIVVDGFILEHCGNNYPGGFYKGNPTHAQAGLIGARCGSNWVIQNNLVRYAKTLGVDIGNEGGNIETGSTSKGPYTKNQLVQNNVITDCGTAGIMGLGINSSKTLGNVITRIKSLPIDGAECGGMKYHFYNSGLVQGNVVTHSKTIGIYMDNDNHRSVVRANVVTQCNMGIFVELTRDEVVTVENNVLVKNIISGLYTHDASNIIWVHNLVAQTNGGASGGCYSEGFFLRRVTTRVSNTRNHKVYNNIFVDNSGGELAIPYPCGNTKNNLSDYNFFNGNANNRMFWISKYCETHPWGEQITALREYVYNDLGSAAPEHIDSLPIWKQNMVGVNFSEWKAFWAKHGFNNDRNSKVGGGTWVELDLNTMTLVLNLEADLSTIGSKTMSGINKDFFGNAIPQDGTAIPGPFQNLKKGDNTFRLSEGLQNIVSARDVSPKSSAAVARRPKPAAMIKTVARIMPIPEGATKLSVYTAQGKLIGVFNTQKHAAIDLRKKLSAPAHAFYVCRFDF